MNESLACIKNYHFLIYVSILYHQKRKKNGKLVGKFSLFPALMGFKNMLDFETFF